MEKIKLVWKDGNNIKTAKGELIEEDDTFITLSFGTSVFLTVSKLFIVSIRRYKND